MKALADTNFIVALLDRKDSLHRRATELNDALNLHRVDVFYADCVINEVVSVVLRRLREQKRQTEIEQFLQTVEQQFPVESLTWTYSSLEGEWSSVFETIRTTHGKLNFHDALLSRAANILDIPSIVSFDVNLDAVSSWTRISRPNDLER